MYLGDLALRYFVLSLSSCGDTIFICCEQRSLNAALGIMYVILTWWSLYKVCMYASVHIIVTLLCSSTSRFHVCAWLPVIPEYWGQKDALVDCCVKNVEWTNYRLRAAITLITCIQIKLSDHLLGYSLLISFFIFVTSYCTFCIIVCHTYAFITLLFNAYFCKSAYIVL